MNLKHSGHFFKGGFLAIKQPQRLSWVGWSLFASKHLWILSHHQTAQRIFQETAQATPNNNS